jgi:proteasome accessory factor A
MSEYVTALKVGSMLLVLDLIESGQGPDMVLADPLGALKSIARDQTRQWRLELDGKRQSDALEVQRAYLERARAMAAGRDDQTDWVLGEWTAMLDGLAADPAELVGRCDWVTKKWLLDAFVEAEGLDWGKPEDRLWLQSQDLEYHNIDPEDGLYQMLERGGDASWRLTDEKQIRRATKKAPVGTRAYFRGRSIEKFGSAVRAVNWDSIEFDLDGRIAVVDLKGCVDADTAAKFNGVLDACATAHDLVASLETVAALEKNN